MKKDELVHYLYVIVICLAMWAGYIVGQYNG
jgi:hypothetical protein